MKNELIRILRIHPIESITLIGTVCAAVISFVVYVAVWQSTISMRVSADETNINTQSTLLQKVNDTVNNINARGQVTSQQVNDINDKVNLIYENIKK